MPLSIAASPKDFFHQHGRGTGAGSASDQQVRLVIRYGGLLDPARLAQAIRAVFEGDPMLRARLVETAPFQGRWEVRDDEGAVPACPLEEPRDPEPAIAAFLADTAVRDEGPYVQLRLIRAAGRDALCLRVDHRLCDGAGTKLLASRLSDAYRRLAAGAPLPPPRRELLPRTVAGLTGREPLPPPPPEPPWEERYSYAVPRRGFRNEAPAHAVRLLDAAAVAAARRSAKALGATLTDVLLAALERALDPLRVAPPGEPLLLMFSADYRSRLPPGTPEVLCNLFQPLFPGLRHVPGRSFRAALADAVAAMARLRPSFTLDDALQAEAAFAGRSLRFARQPPVPADPARRDATFVLLSNIGVLDPERLDVGGPPVVDAQMMGTIALLREILVSASSFRGALTLSIGYCRSDVEPAVPEGILDRLSAELLAFAAEG